MRVFGIGETVYDIIFKDGTPIASKAGGSVLNTLVSLARTGVETYFVSELGKDNVANIILSFLKENGVDTKYIHQYNKGQSALAMAFLDDKNDATYEFHKNYPEDRLKGELPQFRQGDILLFGSSYAIDKNIRTQVVKLIAGAKKAGAIVMYDPNFRSKDGADNAERIEFVKQNMAYADIIRGSNEDYDQLFNLKDAQSVYATVADSCRLMVYTKNANCVDVITSSYSKSYPVDKITPVSTIGAGDNFNAGIIYSLVKLGESKETLAQLNNQKLSFIINNAKQFSSTVCMSLDNYVPEGFMPITT